MIFRIDGFNALRRALQTMCSALRDDVPEGTVFNCKLVADELVSNALQYGGGSAVFSFERTGDTVRITVKSANEYRPPEESACSPWYEERGRGLFLVDAVSEERFYDEDAGINVVIRISTKEV